MIGAICLIGLGAALTLYFTQASFRNRVNDLCAHVGALFKQKPDKTPEPEEATTVTPPTPPTST